MADSKEYIDEIRMEGAQNVSLSICRTKLRRAKVAKKIRQRKSKFMGCTCHLKCYNPARLSTTSNEQDFNPIIPWHAIFVFLDPIFLGVMQVEYQNKEESPFASYSLQKQIFLTAISIYGALLGIKIHTKTFGCYLEKIVSYGLLLCGVFSSVSLLSVLLQQQLLWIVLIVWGSVPVILSHRMLKSSVFWMIKMVAKLSLNVCDKHSSVCGNNDICPRVEAI